MNNTFINYICLKALLMNTLATSHTTDGTSIFAKTLKMKEHNSSNIAWQAVCVNINICNIRIV